MIARLRGEILEADAGCVVVDVHGVGYEVHVPASVLVHLPPVGSTVELRIRQVFREDGVTLYGFTEARQRRMFDLLTEVKGCGPKIALAVLSDVGEESAAAAIVAQDARTLSKATGVGARLAERIILELRDKVQNDGTLRRAVVAGPTATRLAADDDAMEALLALGYRRQEVEGALMNVDEAQPVPERIRLALRELRK